MNNTKLEDVDFMSIGAAEARELGPYGNGDGPVTVTCYREKEQWKSRKAAREFYRTAAMCCDGSEADRYWTIVSGLEDGLAEVSDS